MRMVAAGLRAGSSGTPLGPPNPYQQDTAEAIATGSAVYTTTVTGKRPRL